MFDLICILSYSYLSSIHNSDNFLQLTFLEFYEIVILCAKKSVEKECLEEASIKARKMEEDDVNGKPSNISSNGPVGSQSIANIKKKKK